MRYVTATRIRPGGRDVFGDPLPASELDIPGCTLRSRQGRQDAEDSDAANTVVSYRALDTPPGSDVGAQDQVRVEAQVWDVDGEPYEPTSKFSGWTPARVVPLRRATG